MSWNYAFVKSNEKEKKEERRGLEKGGREGENMIIFLDFIYKIYEI